MPWLSAAGVTLWAFILCFKAFNFSLTPQAYKTTRVSLFFYVCAMKEEDIQRVKDISGYVHSHMPFRYLGVSICSKRLSISQYEMFTGI